MTNGDTQPEPEKKPEEEKPKEQPENPQTS